VLRRILRIKRREQIGRLRKLQNEEHRNLYNVYKILVGKHEGKRPLGTRRCRCEDNIKEENLEK
jgi:hypothetical protein